MQEPLSSRWVRRCQRTEPPEAQSKAEGRNSLGHRKAVLPILGLAGIAACAPRSLQLDVYEGDWVIFASVDEQGRLGAPYLIEAHEPFDTVAASAESGDDGLLAYAIPRDQARLSGLPEGSLPVAKLRSEASVSGCGRCLVPAPTPPFALSPGSACSVPSWASEGAEPSSFDGFLKDARSQLFLVADGECPFPLRDLDSTPVTLQAELVSPRGEEAFAFHFVAGLADGTMAQFGRRQNLLKAPGGSWVVHPEATDSGHVIAVTSTPEHFVVARRGQQRRRSDLEIFDRDLVSVGQIQNLGPTDTVLASRLVPGRFFVSGAQYTVDSRPPASLLVCEGSPPTCDDIGPKGFDGFGGLGLLELDDGQLVLIFQSVGLVVYERVPTPGTVLGVDRDQIRTTEGEIRVTRGPFENSAAGTLVGSTANRLVSCRRVTTPELHVEVVTASVTATQPFDVHVLHEGPDSICTGISHPDSTGAVEVFFGMFVARVSREGRLESLRSVNEAHPEIEDELHLILPSPSTTFAVDASGGLYAGPPGETLAKIYGGDLEVPHHAGLIEHAGATWLIHGNQRFHLTPTGVQPAAGVSEETLGLAASDGERILSLNEAGLIAFDPVSGSSEVLLARDQIPPDRFDRLVATEPGVAVALRAQPFGVLRLSTQGAVEATLDWDDPTTPDADEPPSQATIVGADAVGGVLWVGVRNGEKPAILLRILTHGDTPTGTRTTLLEEVIAGVVADAPDRVYAIQQRLSDRAPLAVEEIRATPDGIEKRELEETAIGRLDDLYLNHVAMAGRRLVVFSIPKEGQATVDVFPSADRLEVDGTVHAVSADANGVWVWSEAGRIWRIGVVPK